MKRTAIISATLLACLLLILLLIAVTTKSTSHAPRFIPLTAQPAGPFTRMFYDWADPVPFQNDRLWIWASNSTNRHCYLYNVRNAKVIGELLDTAPVFSN